MRIMIKLVRTGFLAAVIAMGAPLATTAPAQATSLYDNPKYAAIMINPETHEVLYSRRADVPRYPASITKKMTLYLAFERSEEHTSELQSLQRISYAVLRQKKHKKRKTDQTTSQQYHTPYNTNTTIYPTQNSTYTTTQYTR